MPLRSIRFLAGELWTPIAMWRSNSMIRQRAIATGGPIATLSNDDLAKLIEAEWTRGKELDDKLQKLTAALSVSVTIGGLVGSTMLQDLVASGWKLTAAVLFLMAAALLLTGVLIGFNGLRPKPRYGYGAGYLSIVAAGGDTARNEMIAAARSFERDNMLRANEAVAAIVSIRNGVLVFASAMLVGLVAAGLGKADVSDRTVHAAKYESPASPDDEEQILGSAASVNHQLLVGASSVPSANFIREGKRDAARSLTHNHGTGSPCDKVARTIATR